MMSKEKWVSRPDLKRQKSLVDVNTQRYFFKYGSEGLGM
jgi:hypothetical protein